jgi:hypothetical protein
MAETAHCRLPLLAAAQAQKHVTVNEALVRLDALAPGVAESATLAAPPAAPAEGAVYAVPAGGGWPGKAGELCLWLNGGWLSVAPGEGWRLWVRDEGTERVYRSGRWERASGLAVFGLDVALSGAAVQTLPVIPDKAVVFAVTGRVLTPLTGVGVTGWRLGVPGAAGRYGAGYGVAAASFAQGVTGQPVAYYAPTPLLVEAEGGAFTGGTLRLAVHALVAEPPAMPG